MKTTFIYPHTGTPPRTATFDDETFTCEAKGGKNGDGSPAPPLTTSYVTQKQTGVVEVEHHGRMLRIGKDTDKIDLEVTKAKFAKALDGFAHFEKVSA